MTIASSFPGSTPIGSFSAQEGLPDAIKVFVNGVDLTGNLFTGTSGSEGIRISQVLTGTTTGRLVLVEEDAPSGPTLDVQIGHSVVIEHRTGRIFGGTIEDLARSNPGQSNVLFYRLRLKDYTSCLEQRLVPAVFEDTGDPITQTAGSIITTLHSSFLSDSCILLGEIADGPLIQKAVFDYVTVADALNDIQRLTGNAFYWHVDPFGILSFRARTEVAAPYEITEVQTEILGLEFDQSREAYRNRQYVRGGKTETTATKTDDFNGDGDQKTFTLSLPVASKPVIKVNTIAVSPSAIGVKGIDEDNATITWLYAVDDAVIAAKTAPLVTDDIEVEYTGLFPILVQRDDPGEQTSRAAVEPGDGLYEAIDVDETLNLTATRQKADALLDKYSRIPKRINYRTDRAGDIQPGMLQTVNLTRLAVSGASMVVEQVDITLLGDDLRRSVNATDGREWLEWLEFWRGFLKKPFSIRENESVLTPITLSENLAFTDSVVVDLSDQLNGWLTDPYSFMIVGSDWSIAKQIEDGEVDGPDIGDPLIT